MRNNIENLNTSEKRVLIDESNEFPEIGGEKTTKNRRRIFFLVLLVAVLLAFTIFGFYVFMNKSPKTAVSLKEPGIEYSTPIPVVVPESEVQISSLEDVNEETAPQENTSNILIYRNDEIGYEVSYPDRFTLVELYNGVAFDSPDVRRIYLACPRGAEKSATTLPYPYDWEGNEGGYTTKYYDELTINGMIGVQYIWGTGSLEKGGYPHTAVLREEPPLACELMMQKIVPFTDFDNFLKSYPDYENILNSFRFL